MGSCPIDRFCTFHPMFFNPSILLFRLCIIGRIFIIGSSPVLLFSWLALELNTITFIPLILNWNDKSSCESAVKYFLTQTFASILFLLGAMPLFRSLIGSLFITVGLLIKLGAAPFHSWLPGIIEALSWKSIFVLLTIQRVGPLLILNNFFFNFVLVDTCIWLSLLVGGFMGLIQTQIRSLLTYSSINHIGWILVASQVDNTSVANYFLFYSLLLAPVVILFGKLNYNQIRQLTSISLPIKFQFLVFFLLLSLGGLPPFLGFLPKWMVFQRFLVVSEFNLDIWTCFIIILMRLLTLFYYLRLSFSAFVFSNSKWNLISSTLNFNYIFFILTGLSILGLLLRFLVTL